MFEKLHFRKLKKLYDNVIYLIDSEDDEYFDEIKAGLDLAYENATQLFNKMHDVSIKKDKLLLENWQELERMLTNLSTLCHYFYGYSSYYHFLQYDELFKEKMYENAKSVCQTARFHRDNMFGFHKSELNEPKLYVEKNGEKTYCVGLQRIIDGYYHTLQNNVTSTCVERERAINKILEEIKEREEAERKEQERIEYERWQAQKQEEYDDYIRKCRREIERDMERASSFSHNPRVSLDCYISAYNWACEDEEFEEEKEIARRHVVDAYVKYIESTTSFVCYSQPEFKMKVYQEAIDLCDEAYEWTHDCDEHKIDSLKSDMEYEYRKAYDEYRYED